jgi:hypothetical protein
MGRVEGTSKFTWVSPGHFQTLRTAMLAGRDFNTNDTETSPKVAIVNQTFVRRYLGGAEPIGKTFRTAAEPNYPETNTRCSALKRRLSASHPEMSGHGERGTLAESTQREPDVLQC